jgi:predicted GNAT superfamily acetyltransferase
MVHSGSYLSGAFIDNKIVGAAFAFPATNDGLHLHSHMTAVLDEYRDQGVGYALKIDQWHWAKKNNYPGYTKYSPVRSNPPGLNTIPRYRVDDRTYPFTHYLNAHKIGYGFRSSPQSHPGMGLIPRREKN